MYLRFRTVKVEEACRTQAILDHHAEKTLRTTVEPSRSRRRRMWERRECRREERRTGTG